MLSFLLAVLVAMSGAVASADRGVIAGALGIPLSQAGADSYGPGPCPECGEERFWIHTGGYACEKCPAAGTDLDELWAYIGEWPEEPDVPGSLDPDQLPLDALPEVLRDAAATLASSTQAPLDSAIGAVLGGVSVAVVGKAKVEIRADTGWVKPVHTYIGIEQPSGTGKSPLINAQRGPIAEWERRKADTEHRTRKWNEEKVELEKSRVQAARRAAAKDRSAESELEDAIHGLAEAESLPQGSFQLLISDATEEEVVRVLNNNKGRAASIDPEGTILEVAAGRYGNGDARLAVLTHGWDGEAMRVNRVTRARVDLPSANLALLIGVQPGILAGLASAETMKQKGVLNRWLWISPKVRWDEMLTGRDVPALDRAAVARYERAILRILDSSDKSEAFQGPDTPTQGVSSDLSDKSERFHVLRMSPEAQEGVYRLEQMKVDGMRPGGPLESVPGFAGKLPDHGSRIAALLTIVHRADRGEDLYADPIPGWAMESAERLIAAISTHVVKVIGDAGADDRTVDLRYLLDRCIECDGETESDIQERARARTVFRENPEYTKELLSELQERGCIRRFAQARRAKTGRPPSKIVEVHPSLKSSDKSEKRADEDSQRADGRSRGTASWTSQASSEGGPFAHDLDVLGDGGDAS